MRRLLLCASIATLLALPGCGGGKSEDVVADNSAATSAAPGTPPAGDASSAAPSSGPPGGGAAAGGSSSGPPGGMPGMSSSSGPPGGMPGLGGEAGDGLSGGGPPNMSAGYAGSVPPGGNAPAGAAGGPGIPFGGTSGGLSGDLTSSEGPVGGLTAGGLPGGAPGGLPGGFGAPGGVPGSIPGGFPGEPGGFPGSSNSNVPEVPKGLDGMAKLAFRNGKDKDALQYLYAYGLTTDQGAREIIGGMKWAPALKRPSAAVRWGVGVHVSAKPDVRDNLSPIGPAQQGGGGPGGNDSAQNFGGPGGPPGGSGFPGGGGGGGGGGNGGLSQSTGELGDKLIEGLRSRVESESFGKVLKDALSSGGPGVSGGEADGANPAGFSAPGGAPGFSGPGGLSGAPGGFAGPPGGFSAPGGAPGGPPGGFGFSGQGGQNAGGGSSLAPGITMLGQGTEKELLEKARREGVDALALFEVNAQKNPKVGTVNETKIAIIDVVTGKDLHTSKGMNNVQVQKARAQNKDDGIETVMKALFTNIDKNFALVELPPALNSERAVARVSSLAAKKHDNPLPVLAEMKLYHVLSLIKDEDLIHGYDGLVGGSLGAKLAAGSDEERKQVIEKWLPK